MDNIKLLFILLCTAQLLFANTEKDVFFEKHPSLENAVKFFCKTSPEREIQFLESEKQLKFSLFTKLIDLGGEIAGAKTDEGILGHLDRIYADQISYFNDIEPLVSEGGELYYVHFLTSDKREEALGYIVLLNGEIIYDDTFNLVAEAKLSFKAAKKSRSNL